MLKRIKVRSKLLLLVITPLIALAGFATVGVGERLDSSDFFSREERIAELADAGADLTLAVHVERNRTLQIHAGGAADIEGAVIATDAAVDRWLGTAATARADLTGSVVGEIETFALLLSSARESRSGSDMAIVADQLLVVGRSVNSITIGLTSEARDLELYRALSDYIQLSRVEFGLAEITTIGAESVAGDGIATGDFALLQAGDAAIDAGIEQFRNFADPVFVAQFQALVDDGLLPQMEATDPIIELQLFINRRDRSAATVEWLRQGEDRLMAVHQVSSALLGSSSDSAELAATTAADEARSFLILAGAVIIGAIVLALVVGRSISRPLRRLTTNAERLSSEELPALVESMRQGTASIAKSLTPIDTRGRDEIAKLSTAISDIQDVAVAVAEEQGELLKRGISDMFVNLARRNQSLLDRQIEFIDQLEASEEDPETLENLFRLDHLATRMRRNAESLLVLAGADSSRRRGQAVEIVDVVRVAMGEIEDYSRIRMLSIAQATVAGSVAVDLAHLLSELMENASQFSPPDMPVEVVGQRTEDGKYQLTVTDHGIGLSADQLVDANHILANPPVVGLELSRSLGFTVVSRLAHRLGISARLALSAHGGVTGIVSIPAEMTGELSSTEPVAESPDVLHALGLASASSEPIGLPDGTTAGQGLDWGMEDLSIPATEQVQQEFGSDPLFDLGVGAASAGGSDPERPDPPSTADRDIFASLDTSVAETTTSGLPLRTPRTAPSPTPEARESAPQPPRTEPEPAARPTPAASVGVVDPSVTSAGLIRRTPRAEAGPTTTEDGVRPTSVRSPEEVRQMLSRYRTGLRQGRETPTS
jgi:signal transduction histidine kinase